jgi:antitoxin HicB
MQYAVRLSKDDNGTFLVKVPDVPEAITYGDTKEEALARAVDAILTVFDECIRTRRPIPAANTPGALTVEIPVLEAAKVALYQTMADQRVSKSELGRRLNVHPPQIDRILNVRHASQMGQVVSAFQALGKRVELRVVDEPTRALPGFLASVTKKPLRAPARVLGPRAMKAAKKR